MSLQELPMMTFIDSMKVGFAIIKGVLEEVYFGFFIFLPFLHLYQQ